jgi:hypothetical protein
MPSIFHRLQRRASRPSTAKSNGKHDNSMQAEHANAQNGNGVLQRKSSSTINSSQIGSSDPSITPATSTTEDSMDQPKTHGPTPLPVRSPTRAQRPGVDPLKRYSMNVGASGPRFKSYTNQRAQGVNSYNSNGSQNSMNRSSLLAPRVISVSDGSWVGYTNQ